METKFLKCAICGNVVCQVVDSGVTPVCCGSQMSVLEPKTDEVGLEKHLPVATRLDLCTIQVKVGSAPHPSTPEHHIVFIALLTRSGIEIKPVPQDGNAPEVKFNCPEGEEIAVYAYCNLHGLWMTNLGKVL